MHLIWSLRWAGSRAPWYLSHFKSMPVAALKSMSVLHLGDSSAGSPQRAWTARRTESEIRGGGLATDLHNYPVLLPESKCDPIEIIAYWKQRSTSVQIPALDNPEPMSRCG